jgi:hypothetical protein
MTERFRQLALEHLRDLLRDQAALKRTIEHSPQAIVDLEPKLAEVEAEIAAHCEEFGLTEEEALRQKTGQR